MYGNFFCIIFATLLVSLTLFQHKELKNNNNEFKKGKKKHLVEAKVDKTQTPAAWNFCLGRRMGVLALRER